MKITKRTRAVLGIVALGAAASVAIGGAFTGTGLSTSAGASQFIGGTVSQSVTGASLSTIAYTFADSANTAVTAITLTFADASADGKPVTVAATGAGTETFTCGSIVASVSTCAVDSPGVSYTGLTSLAVTVG